MKNIKLDWSKAKVDAMVRARGPIKGVVAVIVSEKLGGEYGMVSEDRTPLVWFEW